MAKPNKHIAIFCDGTWNKSDAQNPTNVVKLAQSVHHFARDGKTPQVIIYLEGVGTGRGTGKIAKFNDRVLGGALGWGLLENIKEAYRALIFNYEPGDQIYLFGFSRGAYTARSLGGLIRKAGILRRQDVHRIDEAIELYKLPGEENKPDEPHIQARRAALSPLVATSPRDRDEREGDVAMLRLAYLGVWDTVGALGVPSALPFLARPFNRKYDFHDHELSSSVASARHAVAIDETRKTFPPTFWKNLDNLNARFPAEDGKEPNYQELWFPGDHSSIGGGGAHPGLPDIAMDFIAQGASAAGLHIDEALLGFQMSKEDCLASVDSSGQLSLAKRLLRKWKKHRDEVTSADQAALATVWRVFLLGKTYNPPTLRPIRSGLVKRAEELDVLPPGDDEDENED